jgi:hypothetical protein
MKIDYQSIIVAFDACTKMRLQEIVVEGKSIRFLTSAKQPETLLDPADDWIRQHGEG